MKLALTLLAACCSLFLVGQTGPGGVGSTDGTSDLRFWYAASAKSQGDGTPVTAVSDLSGYGNQLTAAGGFSIPRYHTSGMGINGFPAIRFDGGDRLDGTYQGNSSENMSFIVVLRKALGTDADVIIQHGGRIAVGLQADNTYYNDVGGIENAAPASAGDNQWVIHDVTFDTAAINGLRYFQNSSLLSAQSYTPEDTTGNTYVGGNAGGAGTRFKGDLAEVMKFTKVLNAAERIIIDNYLSAKYDLPLEANDVYAQDSVERGNYDFDVAGIGRVDADNFHADARGGGTVRMLNPSDLEDDEFLLWGHDGGSELADNYNDIPDGVDSRLGRVWRVSEVSTQGSPVDVGALEIRWDLSANEPVPAGKLRLLIDLNDNGSFVDDQPVGGAVALGDSIFAFTGVSQLANGRRFSLGIVQAEQLILPVKLITFSVDRVPANGTAKIMWQTAQEADNDYFTVERSSDATHWEDLQKLSASGNATTGAHYATVDRRPLPGTSYYRLRQTDTDGTSRYSPVAILRMERPDMDPILVYPNPSIGPVTATGLPAGLEDQLRLYDAFGREVTHRARIRQLSAARYSFDVSQLPKGTYLLVSPSSVSRVVRL